MHQGFVITIPADFLLLEWLRCKGALLVVGCIKHCSNRTYVHFFSKSRWIVFIRLIHLPKCILGALMGEKKQASYRNLQGSCCVMQELMHYSSVLAAVMCSVAFLLFCPSGFCRNFCCIFEATCNIMYWNLKWAKETALGFEIGIVSMRSP